MDLKSVDTEELKAELKRRETYKFSIGEVEFELTLEQVKLLQAKLNEINPPFDPYKAFKEASEKAIRDERPQRPVPYLPAPINPWPIYPGDIWPPKIWCAVEDKEKNIPWVITKNPETSISL